MIVKIFPPTSGFHAVSYNTGKVDKGKGELMRVANFGPLQSLGQLRPEDYKHYLQMIAALNPKISKPQFHATISAKGKEIDNEALTALADRWMEAMGYGEQPYLIVFHKDTAHNHVHLVSVRVDRNGKKINSDFEHRRAVAEMTKLMMSEGLEKALGYKVSTVAQFKLLLEHFGYYKVFEPDVVKISEPDQRRVMQLKEIFKKYPDAELLKAKFGLELAFHGRPESPYGYTVIDHAGHNVFKGGIIMPLKQFLGEQAPSVFEPTAFVERVAINISHDIDDEAVHGRKRRKKQKKSP